VATAHASAATLATAFVDAKLATHGSGGDIGLELFVDLVVLVQRATAMGTDVGKRRFEDFVKGVGRRRWAMAVSAMLFADLTAGLFGPLLGSTFGKRGSLAFAGAFLLVESPFEIGDALPEFGDEPIAFDAARAWSRVFVHAGSLRKHLSRSCAKIYLS
jgi:hypothetical protein